MAPNQEYAAFPIPAEYADTCLSKLEYAAIQILAALNANPHYCQPHIMNYLESRQTSLEIIAVNSAVELFKTIEVFNNPPPAVNKGDKVDEEEKSISKK